MKVDIVLQRDRAGQPDALRHHKMPASCFRKCLYSLSECIRIECNAVPCSPEVSDADFPVRDLRAVYLSHAERKVFIEISEFISPASGEQKASGDGESGQSFSD